MTNRNSNLEKESFEKVTKKKTEREIEADKRAAAAGLGDQSGKGKGAKFQDLSTGVGGRIERKGGGHWLGVRSEAENQHSTIIRLIRLKARATLTQRKGVHLNPSIVKEVCTRPISDDMKSLKKGHNLI